MTFHLLLVQVVAVDHSAPATSGPEDAAAHVEPVKDVDLDEAQRRNKCVAAAVAAVRSALPLCTIAPLLHTLWGWWRVGSPLLGWSWGGGGVTLCHLLKSQTLPPTQANLQVPQQPASSPPLSPWSAHGLRCTQASNRVFHVSMGAGFRTSCSRRRA
jgi:hypothetical protein